MPFGGIEVDQSFLNPGGGSVHLDEGYHLFKVQGITASPQEYDKNPYWEWELLIADGPSNVGRTWKPRVTWAARAQFRNAQLLQALGFDVSKLANLKIGANDYAKFAALATRFGTSYSGKAFGALVGDGSPDDKGRARSEIMEAMSEEQYRSRAALAAANPAAARPSARPTTNGSATSDTAVESGVDEFFADEALKL